MYYSGCALKVNETGGQTGNGNNKKQQFRPIGNKLLILYKCALMGYGVSHIQKHLCRFLVGNHFKLASQLDHKCLPSV